MDKISKMRKNAKMADKTTMNKISNIADIV